MSLVAACGEGVELETSEDGTTSVDLAITAKAVQYVHLAVADELGFFQDNGLDVSIVTTGDGPENLASIVGGSVDFAGSGVQLTWPAIKHGEKIVSLLGGELLNYALVVRPDVETPHLGEPYPAPVKDIEGLKVGITSRGAIVEQFVDLLLEDAGMSPKDVTYVAIGSPPQNLASFDRGEVDALVAFPPVLQQLGEEGSDYKTIADAAAGTAGDTFDDFLINSFVTSDQLIEKYPEVVKGFCNSMREAISWADDDKNAGRMAEILSKWSEVSVDEASEVWTQQKDTFRPDISKDLWNAQSQFSSEDLGNFTPDYSEFVYSGCQQ